MDTLLQDLRYSLRRLTKSPAFAAIVVLTLGLGIGANTAIFSAVNAILLNPLPYHEPRELVTIQHLYPSLDGLEAPVSAPGFRDYQEKGRSFESMAVQTGWAANLTGVGDPVRIQGAQVTGRYFTTLQVPALLGRTIQPGEDSTGRDHVVVLSFALWQRLFGAEPGVLGRTVSLNGESYQVVGVMPREFREFFNRNVELWKPLVFQTDQLTDEQRTSEYLNLTARLKDGVKLEAAEQEMRSFAEQLKRQYPDNYAPDWSLTVSALSSEATGNIRPALLVLLGAVGFVLLIACANVANLLLSRAAARGKEIAIRSALGATRDRLVRQLLTESVILSLCGGVIGLLLAYWGVRSLVAINAGNLPRADEIRVDGSVMLFTLGVSLLAGLLFGLAPALHVAKPNLQATLKEGGRGSAGDRGSHAIRRMLVVAEMALALTLLTGAGLLIKSFARLQGVDPGFVPEHLLTFNLSLPDARYSENAQQVALLNRVLPAIAAVPGVRSAGITSVMPFGGQLDHGELRDRGIPGAGGSGRAVGGHPQGESGLLRDAPDPRSSRPGAERSGPGGHPARRRHRRRVRPPVLSQGEPAGQAPHLRAAGGLDRHDGPGVDRGRGRRRAHQARRPGCRRSDPALPALRAGSAAVHGRRRAHGRKPRGVRQSDAGSGAVGGP